MEATFHIGLGKLFLLAEDYMLHFEDDRMVIPSQLVLGTQSHTFHSTAFCTYDHLCILFFHTLLCTSLLHHECVHGKAICRYGRNLVVIHKADHIRFFEDF